MTIYHRQAVRMATILAKDLLSLGNEPCSPCNRIEFKGGLWPAETDQGGMCEHALVEWMAKALIRAAAATGKKEGAAV